MKHRATYWVIFLGHPWWNRCWLARAIAGLFIESGAPLAPGTELSVEFALPDRPWEKLKAKGKVAWTRKKPERYLLFPGMGVQFTDIDGNAQSLLVDLVEALNRSRSQS
jgi:type IV pilus assembly protein PilZ